MRMASTAARTATSNRPARRLRLLILMLVSLVSTVYPRRVPAVERYELRGVVVSVNRPRSMVTLRHEKIGTYMDAMTMPFFVRDRSAIAQIGPGDQIRATLVVAGGGDQWLEAIVIISKPTKT